MGATWKEEEDQWEGQKGLSMVTEEIKKACSTYVLKCHNETDYSMNILQ